MTETSTAALNFRDLVWTFRRYPARWLVPMLVFGIIGLGYALVHRPDWEVTQPLTVREEAEWGEIRPGRFADLESLRNVQEMILELATSPSVLAPVLTEVGPPTTASTSALAWPSADNTEDLQRHVRLVPPRGTEFGTTELFFLSVKDPDRERALALTTTLCDELDARFRELRSRNAQSVIGELEEKVSLARARLQEATVSVARIESSVGGDLPELRGLHESIGSDSNLRRMTTELEQELRQARTTADADRQLLELLTAARRDPSCLVATPNRLLEAMPALRRLKDGLIDAQLNMAQLQGTMSLAHPLVQAAAVAREEIRGQLHRELEVAVRGLEAEQKMTAERIEHLTHQLNNVEARMGSLAAIRAEYSNLVGETTRCAESLSAAESALTAARANQAANQTSSLIARVDRPQTGTRPEGPGRAVIVAAGLFGGLLTGLGIVFLTVVPAPTTQLELTATSIAPATSPALRPVRPVTRPASAARSAPNLQPIAKAAGESLSLKDALARFASEHELVN